jgi:hypothetical protein
LRANERDWRAAAKLLIVARADQIAMPARVPQFSHQVELRTAAATTATATVATTATATAAAAASASAAPPGAAPPATTPPPTEQHVTLAMPDARAPAWQSLFAAFDVAGNAATRYKLSTERDASTTLIVWDTPGAAPQPNWRAANWWIAPTSSAFPELAHASTLTINGIVLKYADSPRGRLWTSEAFPPSDADTARRLYESWQLLSAAPLPAYATPSQTFGVARSALPAIADAKPAQWLALALLALFIIERILTHARRN